MLPLLKKAGLDAKVENYCPVSNLQFISKILEKIVCDQLQSHLTVYDPFPTFQSAYRKFHSTETALLTVKNDLLLAMNNKQVTLLVLLDLSSAFDTLDHDILLNILRTKFGVDGTVLKWFKSYLSGRSQPVLINNTLSNRHDLAWGVPRGSCLGPLLFILYTSELFDIVKSHNLHVHCYADDTQLYISFSPDKTRFKCQLC